MKKCLLLIISLLYISLSSALEAPTNIESYKCQRRGQYYHALSIYYVSFGIPTSGGYGDRLLFCGRGTDAGCYGFKELLSDYSPMAQLVNINLSLILNSIDSYNRIGFYCNNDGWATNIVIEDR